MKRASILAVLVVASAQAYAAGASLPPGVSFSQSAATVDAYDFVEVTVSADAPVAGNPFTDAAVTGTFRRGTEAPIPVDGFCDSEDGRIFRVRFMPLKAGEYAYSVTYRGGGVERTHTGAFRARDGGHRGLVRVDRKYPWHFVWEGTGEHYFWNGTTTYWLLGWDDDTISGAVERLARLKVNRIRVALNGRTVDGGRWSEPLVVSTDKFRFRLDPWVAARPSDVADPGFDVTRFNLEHWRKCERLLRLARGRDVVVSLIFHLDGRDVGVDPFGKEKAGGEDEQRYYRYAVARLAAFANVMWDVTNEYRLFRDDDWANRMGAYLKERDPYDHLTSVHGHGDFRFRTSEWADFALYQSWDEDGGYAYMLENRREQAATKRPIPQINEEYGYEDHYPVGWGGDRKAPARSADNRRRLAWEMYMAGCYQTTGERADRGTGRGPDSGGGWINGRGDDAMVMLKGYAHIVDFFRGAEWWKMEPHPELAGEGSFCLAEPGRQYAVYLLGSASATLKLEPGKYRARWFNPRTGEWTPIAGGAAGGQWTAPRPPGDGDWALLLLAQ
jgi:hypothetical protein